MSRAHHPWLEPVDANWAEKAGRADPPKQAIRKLGNGDLVHIPPPGSIPHQLTQARSEGTAATRNAQSYGSFGAAREGPKERTKLLFNGATSRQDRIESYDQDLYGSNGE